jgi:hypothetical protein
MAATTRWPRGWSRPWINTRAPASPSLSATTRPTPSVEPVISAVFPFNVLICNLVPLSVDSCTPTRGILCHNTLRILASAKLVIDRGRSAAKNLISILPSDAPRLDRMAARRCNRSVRLPVAASNRNCHGNLLILLDRSGRTGLIFRQGKSIWGTPAFASSSAVPLPGFGSTGEADQCKPS